MASAPQIAAGHLPSIYASMAKPQLLNGLFRDFLTRHFQEGHIEHPELLDQVWRRDERSNILIEMNTRWEPTTTGRRPAVIIKRNDFSNVKIGIANRHQGTPSDGSDYYTTFWTGSHTLFCIGGTGAQAEHLAAEVQRELTEFGPVIQRCVGFVKFGVLSVGAVHKLEEAKDNFVAPVVVGYMYEEGWRIDPQSPRLSKISLSLSNLLQI